MSAAQLAPGPVVEHRVVVAWNAVACATCGRVVLDRERWAASVRWATGREPRPGRWAVAAETAGLDHVRFPAARA